MSSLLRRLTWWLRGSRKEAELREELQFHLSEEADDRRTRGLRDDEARCAAQRDLGNEARVREEVRAIWTWRPLEEISQDLRTAFRGMFKNRAVTSFAVLSLALGIGASTAIYSLMDAILLRPLPVTDPSSLVLVQWRAKPFAKTPSGGLEYGVLHAVDGRVHSDEVLSSAYILPYAAYEQLQQASTTLLSSIFTFFHVGSVSVIVDGNAEMSEAEFVSGDFFRGLDVVPAVGRLLMTDDDRAGADPVVVVTNGYAQRRLGGIDRAIGKQIAINNVSFTVVGVTPASFFGIDPGAAPGIYIPLHANVLIDSGAAQRYTDPNYYWLGIMGRMRPGVTLAQAQATLSPTFDRWMLSTAIERERGNLPVLNLQTGAGGLETLREQYSRPLYVLLAMVGLILAIACANTANLLLARATARRREMAVRLSIGAGKFRLIRQLLTESVALATLSGVLGIAIAITGTRLLTVLLANGRDSFTLHAELNWRVLLVTIGLSFCCGILFGLAPAIQSSRPALVPALKDGGVELRRRERRRLPHLNLTDALVVTQISLLILLLLSAGLFGQTLSNLQHVQVGFNRDNVLQFELNAPQAGVESSRAIAYYSALRQRLASIPGVRGATLSHSSLIKAGRTMPISINGTPAAGARMLQTGPGFFSTMQIPILKGREIDERDAAGAPPVAVVNERFAKTFFEGQDPIGRRLTLRTFKQQAVEYEIVGVAAMSQYGELRETVPPVVYFPYAQMYPTQIRQMSFALRTEGDPLRLAGAVREAVHQADARVPLTNIRTQVAEINQDINQEIVLAQLCAIFAALALVIAWVGLYGTMSYAVARRTREIGIRMALGARRTAVIWMVLRRVCVLSALGLAISMPIARGSSKLVESFLFNMSANDPRAVAFALTALLGATLLASYGPSRRASRIDPATALRHE